MKRINIKLNLNNVKDPTVAVNGEIIDFKKTDGGYVGVYETELDTVELEVMRAHEAKGAVWWLWSLFFLVISAFGIFDVGFDRKCICINYKTTLYLHEVNNVSIDFNRPKAGEKAVECRCDCEAEQTANMFYLDNIAKKRMKIMRIIKALSWVAIVIGTIALTIYFIIN